MAKMIPEKKKFVWVIKNFSSLPSGRLYSAPFLISDVKWRLFIFPEGFNGNDGNDYFNVFLSLADGQSLPSGRGRHVKFRLTLVNQTTYELSIHREDECLFEEEYGRWGWGPTNFLPLTKLKAKDSGFLKEDELRISAKIETLDVIGIFDESKESSEPLDDDEEESKNLDDDEESKDLLKKTPSVKESVDVNGFQVLPSQVESVRRIFELQPDIASEFRGKNQQLRTTCMNFLLSLMETLRQSVKELSYEDLEEADIALGYLKNANFKVDWLETELDQVKEKIETEQSQA